ncbi:hypothetical protein [Salinarimonas rosea]|uniref:hypothetical protein n=1 Tax=Salinarimonas rosea TaxID=552063 RepID=UPI00048BF9DE|nr:hypothetical protein [Salinarimonas rosea]
MFVVAVALVSGAAFLAIAAPALGLATAILAAPFVASLAAGAAILVADLAFRSRFGLDRRIAALRGLLARARRDDRPTSRERTSRDRTSRDRPRKRA